MSTSFEAGTLAGAGSFRCESCDFAVGLQERDQIPPCPSGGRRSFRRSPLFASEPDFSPAPQPGLEAPEWLDEAREALVREGDYLAFEDDGHVRVMPLGSGWTRIGRSLSAQLRLDDATVSRRHALVYTDDSEAKVLDDRSLNGVFRNGERIELAELKDGDTISVGRFAIHFIQRVARDRSTAALGSSPDRPG